MFVLFVMFSFELLCCCLYVVMCCFDCRCKNLKQKLEEHITNNRNNNRTTRITNTSTNINTWFPAHEPPRQIDISKGLAGRFMFFLFYVVLRVVLLFVLNGFMCCFDCKCKHLKRLGEHRTNIKKHKQQHKHSKKNIKQTEIQDFQPTNLREK